MKRENQRVMLTKRLLKDNLIALLMEKDIYQISIRELCEAAGINRTTFYRYYGSQFDLLGEMESDLLDRINMMLMDMDSQTPAQTLAKICAYLEENINLCRLLINNNVDPEFSTNLFQMEPVQRGILNTLQDAFAAEELAYVSTFVTNGCFRMLQRWINKDERESPEEIASIISNLVGIITGA